MLIQTLGAKQVCNPPPSSPLPRLLIHRWKQGVTSTTRIVQELDLDGRTIDITIHIEPEEDVEPDLQSQPKFAGVLYPLALALGTCYFVYAFCVNEIYTYLFSVVFAVLTVGGVVFVSRCTGEN